MKNLQAIWNLTRVVLVVCSFFWFGSKAGIITLLAALEIKFT